MVFWFHCFFVQSNVCAFGFYHPSPAPKSPSHRYIIDHYIVLWSVQLKVMCLQLLAAFTPMTQLQTIAGSSCVFMCHLRPTQSPNWSIRSWNGWFRRPSFLHCFFPRTCNFGNVSAGLSEKFCIRAPSHFGQFIVKGWFIAKFIFMSNYG